jgi:DNA-binding LacI/PurR family transcriptional regulator
MATLKDVAEKAGVSVITVSRVINSPEKVKPETRKQIRYIMDELGYSPNFAAKALVRQRTGIIDVYIPANIDISNPFVMHFISGISEVLSTHMYSFLILRDRKVEHACDGYIATGLLKNEIGEMYQYAKKRKRPLVLFGHTDLLDVDCIDVDNVKGAKYITEYLISMGHSKIAMINVDEDKDYTVDRLTGYQQALAENGIDFNNSTVVYARNNVQGGYDAAKELIKQTDVTGIFCATDTLALGAIRAITGLGLGVPEDISIVGFDGLGHHLLTNPQITTVQQPILEIGKMLAKTLLARIDGIDGRTQRLVEPSLIINQSVARIS